MWIIYVYAEYEIKFSICISCLIFDFVLFLLWKILWVSHSCVPVAFLLGYQRLYVCPSCRVKFRKTIIQIEIETQISCRMWLKSFFPSRFSQIFDFFTYSFYFHSSFLLFSTLNCLLLENIHQQKRRSQSSSTNGICMQPWTI